MFTVEAGGVARLFFALWPDPKVRAELAQTRRSLQDDIQGKWTKEENLHITLAFLGSVPAERIPAILDAAAGVKASSFELQLDRLEFWPKPRIVGYVATRVPETLSGLAASLRGELNPCGVIVDKRPCSPHVTLVRKARLYGPLPRVASIRWSVNAFTLVESQMAPAGSRYLHRDSWCLNA